MDKKIIDRVSEELKKAGVKSPALIKLESKSLANILYPDEFIGGAVHGAYSGGLAWLIATNKRIIFMDKKPFFNTIDEISYDVVSGAKTTKTAFSGTVTLHTRMGDYNISFAKNNTAKKFIEFIEEMRLGKSSPGYMSSNISSTPIVKTKNVFDKQAIYFLRLHNLAVFSTLNRLGRIDSATVYYLIDEDNSLYVLTKSETTKGRNILSNPNVAVNVYDEPKLQTAQLTGQAFVETNQEIKAEVYRKLSRSIRIGSNLKNPPVTKLHDGSFLIIKIVPNEIKFSDYS
ncbi:MAG: PH domain-containing protein [Candidatus Saccharibacteria bacterium]